MKGFNLMNTIGKLRAGFFLLPSLVILLASCPSPFQAGLGRVVNVRPPTVTLESPGAGTYIFLNTMFRGTAEDDYKLDENNEVHIIVTNQPDVEYLNKWTRIENVVKTDGKDYRWSFPIDTTRFPDGYLKIKLKAIDSHKAETETDEIAFIIKNAPPAIALASPKISVGIEDGNLGGDLNWGVPLANVLPEFTQYVRHLDSGGFVAGSISDEEDIYTGDWIPLGENNTVERYPPQIRFWEVSNLPVPGQSWSAGEPPTLEEKDWHTFDKDQLFALGIGKYQFVYNLPSEADRYYGFEIRAQSKNLQDGQAVNFHFPRDGYPGGAEMENSYVLFYLDAPKENPNADIWALEDLFSAGSWSAGAYGKTLTNDEGVDLDDTMPHPYVNSTTVEKSGDFVLRVKATHRDGIASAELYWETEDKSKRGRLIWDAADKLPGGVSNPEWGEDCFISTGEPYNEWGISDPHFWPEGANASTQKIFIFTHNKGSGNEVGSAGTINGGVRGRSKIQEFTGTTEAWDAGLLNSSTWSSAAWTNMNALPDGRYNLYIYARSTYGTPMAVPKSVFINIDTVAPEVEITSIEGAYSFRGMNKYDEEGDGAVINGVVRPQTRFSDSRPEDSGLRMKGGLDNYHATYEQRYILVGAADRDAMSALLADGRYWPPVPAGADDPLAINGISAVKHGAVASGSFMFKSSPLYKNSAGIAVHPESDTLTDGIYYLYVLTRDKAFNVGISEPLRINVVEETDKPVFDFSVGTIDERVKQPDSKHDREHNCDFGGDDGFLPADGGVVRNSFGRGTVIRLRISDDDSLDLGLNDLAVPSKVTISVSSSTYDNDGKVVVGSAFPFDPDEVKQIFGFQPSGSFAGRGAVKEKQGEINQALLKKKLGQGSDGAHLDDGIYKVALSITDYAPAKLKLETDTNDAEVQTRTEYFWFAIDSKNPVLDQIAPPSNTFAGSGANITGWIFDSNGPFEVKEFTIYNEMTPGTVYDRKDLVVLGAASYNATQTVPGSLDGNELLYKQSFTAPFLSGDSLSGTFVVKIAFTDRFGKEGRVDLKYKVDNEPPKVSLTERIKTFNRVAKDPTYENLTNGIVRFTMQATDSNPVQSANWWLLPAGTPLPAGLDPAAPGGTVPTVTGAVASGVLANVSGETVYLNTASITDGKYTLWGIAKDQANNVTPNTEAAAKLQDIYILQEEDKPWFGAAGNITPNGAGAAINASQAVVKGKIYDDDGFFSDNAGTVSTGSVRIWMSTDSNAGNIDITNDTAVGTTYGSPQTFDANGVSRDGATGNVNLGIDLRAAFPGIFANDGVKYYIIEANDSSFGKYTSDLDGTPHDDGIAGQRTQRRERFSFSYDTKPPVIKITGSDYTTPISGVPVYGPKASDITEPVTWNVLNLYGTISDAFLSTLPPASTENYFIEFKIGNADYVTIDLGAKDGNTGGYITSNTVNASGIREIRFMIPAAAFAGTETPPSNGIINFFGLPSSAHTVNFQVKDVTGNTGSAQLTFIKDTDAPAVTFRDIENVPLPAIKNGATDVPWWTNLTTTAATYEARFNALAAMTDKLSVITHNGSFTISGSFNDSMSEINASTIKYSIDGADLASGLTLSPSGNSKNISWSTPSYTALTLPDGVHSIKVYAEDMAGNALETENIGFRVLSQKPTLAVTQPANSVYGGALTGIRTLFTLTGSAASANLKDVKMSIKYTAVSNTNALNQNLIGNNLITLPPTPSNTGSWDFSAVTGAANYTETLNWSLAVTRDMISRALISGNTIVPTLSQGTYEITLIAVDLNDGESPEAVIPFTIDATAPAISFGALYTDNNSDRRPEYWLTNTAQRNVIQNPASETISVTVSDKAGTYPGTQLTAIQRQIRKYDYASSPASGAGVWTTVEDWVDITIPATVTTDFSATWNMTSDVSLTDGYYSIQVRAKDSAYVSGSASWATATPPADGNPAGTSYVYFFISTANPAISISGLPGITKGGAQTATITVTDPNLFNNLAFPAVTNVTFGSDSPVTLPRVGTPAQTQNVTVNFPTATANDGNYTITFTVTNLAGRPNSASRTVTVDNTPPTATIEEPRFIGAISSGGNVIYAYPSDTLIGGERATISGTSRDDGSNASGVKSIWYHLGYVGTGSSSNDSNLKFPTPQQIADEWNDNPTLRGSGWFEYKGATVPPGFAAVPGTATLQDWILTTLQAGDTGYNAAFGGIEGYAKPNITVGTQTYNSASGRWMTQEIDEDKLSQNLQRGGLYSLPFYIRVEDNVGNVSYIQRDIWIYPNGDNPSTTFNNPSAAATGEGAPKGGNISISGVATDNRSVRRIIFRVKVDGTKESDAGWNTTAPTDANIVNFSASSTNKPWNITNGDADDNAMLAVWNSYGTNGANITESKTGWYIATPESASPDPSRGWSFMLNSDLNPSTNRTELNQAILDWGFKNATGATVNDMARVWIEMFVFDGLSEGGSDYNKMSLGKGNTNANSPKPDVRVFYIKDSAPTIDALISQKDNAAAYDAYTENQKRRRQFRFQAAITGHGTPIRTIQVQLPGAAWTTYYPIPTGGLPTGATLNPANPAASAEDITLTYAFDSLKTNNANDGYATVPAELRAGGAGMFTVRVRVTDTSEAQAEHTFTVGIDNFAPLTDSSQYITKTKLAGENETFMGRVFDYTKATSGVVTPANALVRRIDRIYAWFTTSATGASNYVDLSDGSGANLTGAAVTSRSNVTDGRLTPTTTNPRRAAITYDSGGSVSKVNTITLNAAGPNLATFNYPTPATGNVGGTTGEISTNFVKVINEANAAQAANRMTWQPTGTDGDDILWNFMHDTYHLPDGWVYLNYMVIDDAGNTSIYQQKMIIMNNYPQITDVTLYTDNTGQGAVFTTFEGNDEHKDFPLDMTSSGETKPYPSGYLNSGFYSKNRVIGFGIKTLNGNGALHYRVQHVTRTEVTLTRAALTAMAARSNGYQNLYTISDLGNLDTNNWNALGVHVPNPEPGTHFVFQPTTSTLPNYPADFTAKVWAYTVVGNVAKTITKAKANGLNPEVTPTNPNPTANPPIVGDGFNFATTDYFATDAQYLTDTTKIRERTGSRPDSEANNNPNNTAFFLIKVWDSVDGEQTYGSTGYNEDAFLYDAVVVGMNVYLRDSTNPTVTLYDLNPYTETAVRGNNVGGANQNDTRDNAADPGESLGVNIKRGGLYNVGTERAVIKSGYIDPRNNTTALFAGNASVQSSGNNADGYVTGDVNTGGPTNDQVAGKVILRGKVYDDQLVNRITVQIGGNAADAFTILEMGNTTVDGKPARKLLPAANRLAYAYEELHWKDGHTVEWAYIWDTEGTALGNQAITVRAVDLNGPNTGATAARTVTVVPYVVGFERETPKYTTTRSRQGWYSFAQGEANISVLGYNLRNNNTAATNITFNMRTAANTTSSNITGTRTATGAWPFTTRYTLAAIPNTYSSGQIQVNTLGTNARLAYNTPNAAGDPPIATNRSWNKENTSTGSALWINKPHAHIWRTDQTNTNNGANTPQTYFGESEGLSSPGMALEYSTGTNAYPGRLHAIWSSFGEASYYYGHNAAAARTTLNQASNDPWAETDISIFQGAVNNNRAASGTNNTDAQPNFTATFLADGGPGIFYKALINNSNYWNPSATNANDGDFVLSDRYQNASQRPTERFRNNRIVKAAANTANTSGSDGSQSDSGSGTATGLRNRNDNRAVGRIYVTAYDSFGKNLFFGQVVTDGTTPTISRMIIDGTRVSGDATAIAGTLNTASSDAGEFSAVDYDGTGPFVAYYDGANDTIRIAYRPTANTTSTWTRRDLLPSDHDLYKGSGRHVSIKVDKDNHIHLAFYNSVKRSVVYAYMAERATTAANVVTTIIDTVVEGGEYTDISVDNYGNPSIVYSVTSRAGNRDGLRMAYRSNTQAATNGIAFTDPWEAVSMPADYIVRKDRLNIEVWPPTVRGGTLGALANPWQAAVGYASDRYRIGYFYHPTYKGY